MIRIEMSKKDAKVLMKALEKVEPLPTHSRAEINALLELYGSIKCEVTPKVEH